MLDRIKTLGLALHGLGTATSRLFKALVVGHKARCYFCGGKRIRIDLYQGHRWGDITDGEDVFWICPQCEPNILRQVSADVRWHHKNPEKSDS